MNCKDNAKYFWQTLKQGNSDKPPVDQSITYNQWSDYFEILLNQEVTGLANDRLARNVFGNLVPVANSDCLNVPTSHDEIKSSVCALRGNCATLGIDGICVEMFKHTVNVILPYMHALFNQIFATGQFPADWSESVISPDKLAK